MKTGKVTDWSNHISVSTGLQNVMDRYRTDQKAIRYNGNIVSMFPYPTTVAVYFRHMLIDRHKSAYWKHCRKCLPAVKQPNMIPSKQGHSDKVAVLKLFERKYKGHCMGNLSKESYKTHLVKHWSNYRNYTRWQYPP